MNIHSLFFPQRHRFPDSKYNRHISVMTYLNSAVLTVDGLIESGDIMTHVWRKAIKTFIPKSTKPKKILLLGLAGGCNARLINHYFPQSQITAVEIDPFMIKLGKKYFNLAKVKNLHLIIGDAYEYVNHLSPKDQFDLILVDCFIGQKIPLEFEEIGFLQKLRQHGRFVLINRLWWQKEKQVTANFLRSITPHFFFLKTHTRSNLIISLV
jgi:spermidine synthase